MSEVCVVTLHAQQALKSCFVSFVFIKMLLLAILSEFYKGNFVIRIMIINLKCIIVIVIDKLYHICVTIL